MPEQALVTNRDANFIGNGELNRAGGIRAGLYLIDHPMAEGRQVNVRRAKIHFAGLDASEQQHFLHEVGHAPGILADGAQVLAPIVNRQPVEVLVEDFGRRHDDAKWRAELV